MHERELDVAEQRLQRVRGELRLKDGAQPPGDVGVGAGVVARADDRHCIEGNLLLPLPAELVVPRHRDAEELDGECVDGVRAAARVEDIARQHRVEVEPINRDPRPPEHEEIVLRMMRDLPHRRVREERTQWRHRVIGDRR
ncbi:MAG: hypothetical protein RI891_593, partial [Gemmatimonadota bacterium]